MVALGRCRNDDPDPVGAPRQQRADDRGTCGKRVGFLSPVGADDDIRGTRGVEQARQLAQPGAQQGGQISTRDLDPDIEHHVSPQSHQRNGGKCRRLSPPSLPKRVN
jgi:hypothetical protein